jgi:hypothetical protein
VLLHKHPTLIFSVEDRRDTEGRLRSIRFDEGWSVCDEPDIAHPICPDLSGLDAIRIVRVFGYLSESLTTPPIRVIGADADETSSETIRKSADASPPFQVS